MLVRVYLRAGSSCYILTSTHLCLPYPSIYYCSTAVLVRAMARASAGSAGAASECGYARRRDVGPRPRGHRLVLRDRTVWRSYQKERVGGTDASALVS